MSSCPYCAPDEPCALHLVKHGVPTQAQLTMADEDERDRALVEGFDGWSLFLNPPAPSLLVSTVTPKRGVPTHPD